MGKETNKCSESGFKIEHRVRTFPGSQRLEGALVAQRELAALHDKSQTTVNVLLRLLLQIWKRR